MKSLLVVVLALMVVPAVAKPRAGPKDPSGWTKVVYNSTLALYETWGTSSHFLCTARPLAPVPGGYYILSAGHCPLLSISYQGAAFAVADDIGGTMMPVSLVKAHFDHNPPSIDFSVFELKTAKVYDVYPFDEQEAQIGDGVLIVHFTKGIAKQVSHGVVASKLLGVSETCLNACGSGFMVESYGGPGASGAAVISEKTHKIVGIVVYGFGGVNVGFVVEPIARFQDFLNLKEGAK